MARPRMQCMNCGEQREMAAHGCCFRCYRQQVRERDAMPWAAAPADRHNRQILKAQKKQRKVVMTILDALDAGIDVLEEADRAAIRQILRPYVDRMAQGLAPATPVSESLQNVEVKGEHKKKRPVNL